MEDDWTVCSRCGTTPAELGAEDELALCENCSKHLKGVGNAAASLSSLLMEWGKQQEWSNTNRATMTEALELAAQLFTLRINSERPLADGPRLLSTVVEDDELVLTMGLSPTVVWRESFGSWASGHPRVIFQTALSTPHHFGETITIYYLDRANDCPETRDVWTGDDDVLGEFNSTIGTVKWGAPRFKVVLEERAKDRREGDSKAVFRAASALGFYANADSFDRRSGRLTTEVVGELTEQRRRNFATLVGQLLGEQDIEVSFEE